MVLEKKNEQQMQMNISERVYQRRWWILTVLCLLLVAIDTLIINVALPTLALALSASTSELQWMSEAYVLLMAGLLLTSGAINDRFGSQYALLTGLAIFGTASLIAAFASSALHLIIARSIMGVGGALIMPATLSTIRQVFPAKERAHAISIWSATTSLGIVIGSLGGGWLLNHFWWGSIFLINVPLVIITFIAGLILIPNLRSAHPSPLDSVGTILSFGGISSLVFGITEAPELGWNNPVTSGVLILGVLLLGLFLFWEKRNPSPMLDLKLFHNPRFSAASISIALAYFAFMGLLFVVTQYLQFVLGYSPLEAGLRLIPLAVAMLIASLTGGWLTKLIGRKLTVAGGLAITVMGLLFFSTITLHSGYETMAIMLMITISGIGIAATAATDSIMSAVSHEQSGSGASVDETVLELGGTFGIAVLGSVQALGYTNALMSVDGLPAALRDQFLHSIATAVEVASKIGGIKGKEALTIACAAFIEGMVDTALVGAVITLIGVVIALIFLPARSPEDGPKSERS